MVSELGSLGLDYAVHHDANRNFWMCTPDLPAASVTFDEAELKRILPFAAPPVTGAAAAAAASS